MEPLDPLRAIGRRVADPAEQLAQRVAERVIDIVLDSIDLNSIVQRIDIQALIEKIDINEIVQQVDIDHLLSRGELGSLIVNSTSGLGVRLLDGVRSQTVGLDQFVDRWAGRILFHRGPRPEGPRTLVAAASPPTTPSAAPEPGASAEVSAASGLAGPGRAGPESRSRSAGPEAHSSASVPPELPASP